jgi:hypothetical protein
MSQAAINKALTDRLQAFDLYSPGLPVVAIDQETPYKPTIGQPYLEGRIFVNDTVTPTVSRGRAQFVGIYQVTVVCPKAEGTEQATMIADLVVTHFAMGTVLDGDGVRVRLNRHPSQATPFGDGAWLRVPVSIPYQCMV